MKKMIFALCWILISCLFPLEATDLNNKSDETLFISLGSHCEVALQLRSQNQRELAFPFDWLLTLDYPKFIELLQNDFVHFMELVYLRQHPRGNVVNTWYNIDFRHDWHEMNVEKHLPAIREKYERRITRFRELNKYPGKVYFFRSAYDLNLDPTLPTITKECKIISRDHAEALKTILVQKFPLLDFQLIILNYTEEKTPPITGIERVMEFKIRKSQKTKDYQLMLNTLKDLRSQTQQQSNFTCPHTSP